MIYRRKGSLTIFLALAMLTFLTFSLALVEGTRNYYFRVEGEQAMELAEFSILSEYQQELFDNYHLFFLDLDYEQGEESVGILEQQAKKYLTKNAARLQTKELTAERFCRATDHGGSAFFHQAVKWMKLKSGYVLLEELFGSMEGIKLEEISLETMLNEREGKADAILGKYRTEEREISFSVSLPDISFPSVRALSEAVFGTTEDLSKKSTDLSERISQRKLSEGAGRKDEFSVTDMQLFHGYLFENFHYYGAEQEHVWNECLEYQLEYVISGKESDLGNLEQIMWRIFLLRAGGNYLFYHQDGGKSAKAQAEAAALVGFLGNAALIELVKEIILISQAIEEGIGETRRIFTGEKVPLYQNGFFCGIEIGYREYLYLFLNVMNQRDKIYRSMDLVELEVRNRSGYGNFQLDHCVDAFELQWRYQFSGLFTAVPLLQDGVYENRIVRKIYYED